jgi:hypothetical protein
MELQTFRNPKPDLVALLAESGPAGDANGVRGGKGDAAKKKSRNRDKNVSSAAWLHTNVVLMVYPGRHGEACRRSAEAGRRRPTARRDHGA